MAAFLSLLLVGCCIIPLSEGFEAFSVGNNNNNKKYDPIYAASLGQKVNVRKSLWTPPPGQTGGSAAMASVLGSAATNARGGGRDIIRMMPQQTPMVPYMVRCMRVQSRKHQQERERKRKGSRLSHQRVSLDVEHLPITVCLTHQALPAAPASLSLSRFFPFFVRVCLQPLLIAPRTAICTIH